MNSAHWHLLKQLTLRSIQTRIRGSILGWGWIVGQPLLMMTVYTVVFGLIFGGSYEGQPDDSRMMYALGIFLSLGLYNFFSEVLNCAPQIILGNTVYVKKVAFPLELLPLSGVGAPIVTMLVQMVLVIVVALVAGVFQPLGLLYLLPSGVILATLGLGVAFWFSALGVFIRDLQQIAGVMGLVLLYASGIFYSPESVQLQEPAIWTILQFNPIVYLVSVPRATLLFGTEAQLLGLCYAAVFAGIVLWSGYAFFRWIKTSFADVL